MRSPEQSADKNRGEAESERKRERVQGVCLSRGLSARTCYALAPTCCCNVMPSPSSSVFGTSTSRSNTPAVRMRASTNSYSHTLSLTHTHTHTHSLTHTHTLSLTHTRAHTHTHTHTQTDRELGSCGRALIFELQPLLRWGYRQLQCPQHPCSLLHPPCPL